MISNDTNTITIDANHMSAFLSLCYQVDKNLLLYRGRQDVVFTFDFAQYKKYLQTVVIPNHDSTSSLFRFPVTNVSPNIIVQNSLLCKQCFLLDMAQAIYKDISLMSELKLPASKIAWSIEDCSATYEDKRIECLGLYSANAAKCDNFLSFVLAKGYKTFSPNADVTNTYGLRLSVARCAVASVFSSGVPWNYES